MACAHPFTVGHKYDYLNEYKLYSVPCGYCLNCRVDRRNWLELVSEHEFARLGCGSFITLTYDDNHIQDKIVVTPDGDVTSTIRMKDFQLFMMRLKERINSLLEKGENPYGVKMYLTPTLKPKCDITYIGCSEYGSDSQLFERCHFHVVIFGLHYSQIRDLIWDTWQNGRVDIGELQNGGIRYVTKYMDKMPKGIQARSIFDDNGLERPKVFTSRGFASHFVLDNYNDIINNNYTVLGHHNKRLPLASYYKKLLLGFPPKQDTLDFELDMVSARIPHNDLPGLGTHYYSLTEINHQKKINAQNREKRLVHKLREQGISYADAHNPCALYIDSPDYRSLYKNYDLRAILRRLNQIDDDYYDPIPF